MQDVRFGKGRTKIPTLSLVPVFAWTTLSLDCETRAQVDEVLSHARQFRV
jgi:hypothetical protein